MISMFQELDKGTYDVCLEATSWSPWSRGSGRGSWARVRGSWPPCLLLCYNNLLYESRGIQMITHIPSCLQVKGYEAGCTSKSWWACSFWPIWNLTSMHLNNCIVCWDYHWSKIKKKLSWKSGWKPWTRREFWRQRIYKISFRSRDTAVWKKSPGTKFSQIPLPRIRHSVRPRPSSSSSVRDRNDGPLLF